MCNEHLCRMLLILLMTATLMTARGAVRIGLLCGIVGDTQAALKQANVCDIATPCSEHTHTDNNEAMCEAGQKRAHDQPEGEPASSKKQQACSPSNDVAPTAAVSSTVISVAAPAEQSAPATTSPAASAPSVASTAAAAALKAVSLDQHATRLEVLWTLHPEGVGEAEHIWWPCTLKTGGIGASDAEGRPIFHVRYDEVGTFKVCVRVSSSPPLLVTSRICLLALLMGIHVHDIITQTCAVERCQRSTLSLHFAMTPFSRRNWSPHRHTKPPDAMPTTCAALDRSRLCKLR